MLTYRLILKKDSKRAVLVVPFKWMMFSLVVPFLNNQSYYRVEDSLGNVIEECAICAST